MNIKQKKNLYILFGFLVSVILLAALFYNIDFKELLAALKSANYLWLIPNILLIIFTMYLRAYRWRYMIRPVKEVAFHKLMAATCIGFMANNILPLRLGEFVRAYSLSMQDRGITKSASLANIFVERMVFDLVALLLIFGAVLAVSHPIIPDNIRTGTYLTAAIAVLGILFIIVLAVRPVPSGKLILKVFFFLPEKQKEKILSVVIKFSRGLEFITDMRMLTLVAVQTMIIWIIMGLSNYFVFIAFGFDLPLEASFVLLVIVSISILIPSSPGFIGVYHAGTFLTLSIYGIGKEDALSFAIVLHATQYIVVTVMGFYYLKKEHLSLKSLEEKVVED
ncbi:MAG: lysylphosphatidylglycerol synthase transmembrane domain-containing protein [candidate division Zixibacteria bacterium]|nr:lysylphosphatidylglycerol synthase transmembrane domain-containing protein [candidate division Zixibacteria bacterium]